MECAHTSTLLEWTSVYDNPVWMQFCKWVHHHSAFELFLRNSLWINEACFMHEYVFSMHSGNFWAQDNRHAVCEHGCLVCFIASVWTGIIGNIVTGPYLPPDRLNTQQCYDFLRTILLGLFEDMPQPVRQRLNVTYPESWIGSRGLISWPPSLPDIFLLGHLKECSLGQDYWRSYGKALRAVTVVESSILRCIQKHNRSEMVTVLGPFEALPYYMHTYKMYSRECCAVHCHLQLLLTLTVSLRRQWFHHLVLFDLEN
jgi:hypothetical protein